MPLGGVSFEMVILLFTAPKSQCDLQKVIFKILSVFIDQHFKNRH